MKSLERLRKEVKTRFFWASLTVSAIISVTYTVGFSNPELWYFQIPFVVIILGTLPAIGGSVLSVRIASIMLWLDKNLFHLLSRDKVRYSKGEQYSERDSYQKFALYNLWYTMGMTFLILRSIDITKIPEQSLTSLTVSFIFLALIFGSGINLAIFLMKKKSVFCENSDDGSKINLGNWYRSRINAALGPIQIVFFVYAFIKETNFYPFFIILGWSLLICFITSLTSYFVLKKHYIEKLAKRFEDKNAEFFNSNNQN